MTPQDLEHALLAARAFLPDAQGAVLLVHSDTGEFHVSAASYRETTDKEATLAEMRVLLEGAPVATREWQRQIIAAAAPEAK